MSVCSLRIYFFAYVSQIIMHINLAYICVRVLAGIKRRESSLSNIIGI
jgi:hypothetical protein